MGYKASHIGKLRTRLAVAIVGELAKIGVTARCNPADLSPAQGRWRTDHRMDVMRWEGYLDVMVDGVGWRRASVDSWDKMSDCIKGFTIQQEGFGFEVSAR